MANSAPQAPTPLTLRDLTKAQGLLRLGKALGGEHKDMANIMVMSDRYIKGEPDLESLRIGLSPGADFYDMDKNRVGLSSTNPYVFGHEVGHAKDLQDRSHLYKNVVLKGSRKLNTLLNYANLPVSTLVASTPSLSLKTKNRLYNSLAGISALTAAPNILAEAQASLNAIGVRDDKWNTAASLFPGFAAHTLKDLAPMAYPLVIKHVSQGNLSPQISNPVIYYMRNATSGHIGHV